MKKSVLLFAAALAVSPLTSLQADDSELTMALGGFDVDDSGSVLAQVEYRFENNWAGFRPKVGLLATFDSAFYLYAGVGYPFTLNPKWTLTPSISAGYYDDGSDVDLGYDVEFYSQLRLEYELDSGNHIGLGIGHISNADLGDENPGAEQAYVSYRIKF